MTLYTGTLLSFKNWDTPKFDPGATEDSKAIRGEQAEFVWIACALGDILVSKDFNPSVKIVGDIVLFAKMVEVEEQEVKEERDVTEGILVKLWTAWFNFIDRGESTKYDSVLVASSDW